MPDPIVVVDGNNLVARNQHAFDKAVSRTIIDDRFPTGFPVGGIYGLIHMVRRFTAECGAGGVIVAFDRGSPAFRRELCPEYKAQREGARTPEEQYQHDAYVAQTRVAHKVLTPLGIDVVTAPQWEGDDVVAALANEVLVEDDVIIYSSDHDFTQLVTRDGRVRLYDVGKQTYASADPLYHLKRCLDPKVSDNLIGARGIGPAKADKLTTAWAAERPEYPVVGVNYADEFVEWCIQRASTLDGVGKMAAKVVSDQQHVRANGKCTDLHASAKACVNDLKARRAAPSKVSFQARCEEFNLRPFVEEINALFNHMSRIGTVL